MDKASPDEDSESQPWRGCDDFTASSTSVTDYALMIVDHNTDSRLK